MAYVDDDEFAEYVRDQVGTVNATVRTRALRAAEQMCDLYCMRTFTVASGTPAARLFAAPTPALRILRIFDCVSITSVVDNTVTVTDYQPEPIGGRNALGVTVPYEDLRRLDACWSYSSDGEALITVTADWGWLAVPAQVTEATMILAKDILQQRNNNSGVAGFGEFGAVRVRMNPLVSDMLNPLRRIEAFGVA